MGGQRSGVCRIAGQTHRFRAGPLSRPPAQPGHPGLKLNLAAAFWECRRSQPDRLAIQCGQRQLSYAQLGSLADRVYHWAGEARRIGILASRSVEACAAVLGASALGATYVPISLKLPPERLRLVLALSGLEALVCDSAGTAQLSPEVREACPQRILCLGEGDSPDAGPPAALMAVDPEAPAYIIFTSGTTGRPKGVVIPNSAVLHFIEMMHLRYGLSPEDRVAENSDLSFDVSVQNMFLTWRSGASLHIVPPTQTMAPARWIVESQLTVWSSVPSVVGFLQSMKLLRPGLFPRLRISLFAGEALSLESARVWQAAAPNSLIDNLYGPTEVTVVCIGHRYADSALSTIYRQTVAIGEPLPGTRAMVVEQDGQPVARGQSGELALAGPQLASHYLDDPEWTRQRFPVWGGERWYLSGDLAVQDENGVFHCLGRTDNQVKVLGRRIELEEVESHLRAVCKTDLAVVIAWPVEFGNARGLLAFVEGAVPAGALETMRQRVPQYMVPTAIREVPFLPLNANGKIDRKRLSAWAAGEGD